MNRHPAAHSRHRVGRPLAYPLAVIAIAAAACSPTVETTGDADPTVGSEITTSTPSSTDAEASTAAATDPATTPTVEPPPPLVGAYVPVVLGTFPHDTSAYTQGLERMGDLLIESTGRRGESTRRLVEVETGEVVSQVEMAADDFGEGITIVGDEFVQLTFEEETFYRGSADTLVATSSGTYDGEGWGLCHDGDRLVMSNGSSRLTFRDPATFEVTGTIDVTLPSGEPADDLNELECVGRQVLANVYGDDTIVVIDPATGRIDATIDASNLRPEGYDPDDLDLVLNGIAYEAETDTYLLTGKLWPVLYRVRLTAS